jgi:predicted ABC-type ATPase
MSQFPQLWILAGGNGAGKSTFNQLFLKPKGIKFVNADLLAGEMNPEDPGQAGYRAGSLAIRLVERLIEQRISFCYETVFSHKSKIDLAAGAKAVGYEIILVYIHLETPELYEARVHQRTVQGGHSVPAEKIYSRLPRTMENISAVIPLADEVSLLDNSSKQNPFAQVAVIKAGEIRPLVSPLPNWAERLLTDQV